METKEEIWSIRGKRDGLIIIHDQDEMPMASAYEDRTAKMIAATPQVIGALHVIRSLAKNGDAFLSDIVAICNTGIRLAEEGKI